MSIRHTAAAVGIAAAIAGLGGAAVYAATGTHGSGHPGGQPARLAYRLTRSAAISRDQCVVANPDGGV
ncbi:hypothetical protein FZI95_22630 [Mycobacterium sp. CBMA247]|nr:hypothetical protein [Mycolicibacterium sp. CBMA 329]MUL90839.1 hypothetical protein [Mycolicibacterium sp. CBMA 331]MUM01787.1 hypothetical protein [Mycolicibacterium sp. CBMA 334]MUM26610.1 hypothetical protein [Mycolicibacterium sp. CBMA 295]MUM40598.1 hypothetical protein [Mycolicibacterium sp. CBMA 247]MUM46794.1 hypothetical protein [Mycolicibacterium sp. CBMA 294]